MDAKETPVRWLLAGTGDIARKRVAPALAGTAPGALAGVCDIVPERAEQLGREFGATEVYTDLDEALARTSATAVYLATPVCLHAPQAVQVLKAGKHVLVEKPLGISADDARQALRAARDSGLQAGCAYFRRCAPRYAHAAGMLADGEFGRLVLIRMTYFSWFNPEPDDPKYWRVVKARGGGGPLADMATHMFDVQIGLLGMPRRVLAKTRRLVHDYEAEDSAVILMEYEGGPDVVATFHWNSKTWSHEYEIIGTEAKLKWHPYDTGPVVKTVGRDISELDLPGADNVHAPLVNDFVDAVASGRPPVVPLEEALKTNILLDAVYRSAETGKDVTL